MIGIFCIHANLYNFTLPLLCFCNSFILFTYSSFSLGLKLKLQATGKCEDLGSFTYALSPLTIVPRSVDWTIITSSGADCEHIYCHELKPHDDLNELVMKCQSNHAVAVIILNCDQSYTLPQNIQISFTQTDCPVLVLATEDGKKLLKTLQEGDENGEFLAKVLEREGK